VRKSIILTGIGLTTWLAACGEASQPEAPANATTAETPVGTGSAEVQPKSTTGTGSIVALDPERGTVRMTHGPLPEVNWPGMTMTFDAKPGVLEGIAVGDDVSFDVTFRGGSGERKQ
jgi:Cu/Ag efflux protein CusF